MADAGGFAGRRVLVVESDNIAAQLMSVVRPLRDCSNSLRSIAAELTARGIRTRCGGAWAKVGVDAVLIKCD